MPSTDPGYISARPRFQVNGRQDARIGESLQEFQLHLPSGGVGTLEVRLNNWGPGTENRPDFQFQTLTLGDRVEVFLGEETAPAIFEGEVTGVEERYGDGAPQLVLLVEDKLHRLARVRESRSHADTTLDALVQACAQDAGLQTDAAIGSETGTWIQGNESALAFLQRLLGPRNIPLRLQEGRLRARAEEADPSPEVLDPGAKAQRIRILADLDHHPRTVTSAGWNLATGAAVSGEASSLGPRPEGTSGLDLLERLGWVGPSVLPHPFPCTQGEAEALAQGGLTLRARRFLTGELLCRDVPTLRGGREVRLEGVSPRLLGTYRVVDCWHLFDLAEGLRTRLRVERPDWSA